MFHTTKVNNSLPSSYQRGALGRFCFCKTQSYNRYSYVQNNPLKYTDPSGWILKAAPEKDISVDTHIGGGGGGGNIGYVGDLNSITGMGSFGYNYMGSYSAYASNPGGYAATYGTTANWVTSVHQSSNGSMPNWDKGNSSTMYHIAKQTIIDINTFNASTRSNTIIPRIGNNEYNGISWNTATTCENCGGIGANTNTPRMGYQPEINKVLEKTTIGNGLFGLGISAAQEFSLAGQGLYVTSRGVKRAIDFANLTRNSMPYAESFSIIKNLGWASMGIGIGLDYAMYKGGMINKEKFKLNTSITAWGIGIARIGGGTIGLGIGVLYFGIDTFFPGGWNGAMNSQGNLINEYQRVLGGTNMFYKH